MIKFHKITEHNEVRKILDLGREANAIEGDYFRGLIYVSFNCWIDQDQEYQIGGTYRKRGWNLIKDSPMFIESSSLDILHSIQKGDMEKVKKLLIAEKNKDLLDEANRKPNSIKGPFSYIIHENPIYIHQDPSEINPTGTCIPAVELKSKDIKFKGQIYFFPESLPKIDSHSES